MRAKKQTKPEYKPTDQERQFVKAMVACGIPQSEIALVVDIAPKTLRKHFRKELDTGKVEANTKVAQALLKQALNGNTSAMMFWLKTQAGWRETTNVNHSGKIDSLTSEERVERLAELLDAARDRRARSDSRKPE
jgi:hypothetical protein